jgi:hypothetical protein
MDQLPFVVHVGQKQKKLSALASLKAVPLPPMTLRRWSPSSVHFAQIKGEQMHWISKRGALVALGCTCALAAVGVAVGYFTSSGTGTGTAAVGSSSAVTLHATIASNLYPGASSPVSLTVDNPSSASQRIGTVSLASISVDGAHATCSTVITGGNPDFTMPAVTVNKVFGNGNNQSVTPSGTLTMNETGANQDACQGATLTLHLTNN